MSDSVSHATLLGVIQGLTEFLPVSSDGHLALAGLLFGAEGGLALNVLLHAGTLLAIVVVLRQRLGTAIGAGVAALLRPARFFDDAGGRDALTVVASAIPTAVIGLALEPSVEIWTTSPVFIGAGFAITTLALAIAARAPAGAKDHLSLQQSLMLGLIQSLAIAPGVSRSGLTICAALWMGMKPERAFETSMLISVPVVLGAVLLEGRHLGGHALSLSAVGVGAATAFVVGVVALVSLRSVVRRGAFPIFALWTGPLAIATLSLALAWPR